MKFSEMRELTTDEVRAKIETLSKTLFDARFKLATNQLEDTAVFRRNRHEISQLKTVLAQKSNPALSSKTSPVKASPSKTKKTSSEPVKATKAEPKKPKTKKVKEANA